jgi:hypothetical protein
LRDPVNMDSSSVAQRARLRLDWLLEQSAGNFLVSIVSDGGDSSHVFGRSAHRRHVFDHEELNSLPFNRSDFDAACSRNSTCVGLGEVKMVGLKVLNKRKRAD